MSAANTIDIKLHGREFRVACPPEEKDDLLAVAAFLDWKMGEIAKQTKSSGERLAVMTALNLAHELINIIDAAVVSIPSRMHLMRQERDPPEPRFRRLGLTARAGNQTRARDVPCSFFFRGSRP